ncbi:MAG: PTS sugar transporter subunit IIA [Gemmataceae bacterium]
MNSDLMDLQQLATYLKRDPREVSRLASRGTIPARKVGGEWRFVRVEINHWIETQMPSYSEQQLLALERDPQHRADPELVITPLLAEQCLAVPLTASTRGSVLRALVQLAEQSWQVYDPDAILEAIRQREEMNSTDMGMGVAIPHPHRPLPNALGEAVMAYGRTAAGVPFGSAHGNLTDIFFLVCCRDDQTHLRVLARLARLLQRPDFVSGLRQAASPAETLRLIQTVEREIAGKR